MNIEEGVFKAENSKPVHPAMKVNIREVYEQRIQSFHRQYRAIKQKKSMVAMSRLILFVGFIVFFIYHFNTPPIIFPFAIAFIVLTNLEVLYPVQVKNHCFEVQTAQDKLIFDYKIKPGYCKVMNASILMKQIGILD